MPMLKKKQKYFGWYYQSLDLPSQAVSRYKGMRDGVEIRENVGRLKRGYVKVFDPDGNMDTTKLSVKSAKAYIKKKATSQ